MKVRIATRESPLALWQANHVARLLKQAHGAAGLEVELVEMSTEGDRFLHAPLAQVGGKGLFVKEIEQALLAGTADIAVHSLKDMTAQMPEGLCLGAVPAREDPRDAWVSRTGIRFARIPPGGRVGTSSLRRTCQLLAIRPDLEVVPLRGNVQTRLRKVEELELDGTLLALAGLRRLGFESRVTDVIEPDVSLPAIGQGVLAVQCRADDARVLPLVRALDDRTTRVAIEAERTLMARLEGGCTVPLAGYATVDGERVRLRGLIGRPDGTKLVRAEESGSVSEVVRLGNAVAETLLAQGGEDILRTYGRTGYVPES